MNSSRESAAREHTSTLEVENANSNGTRYKCGCKIWKQFGGPWSITQCSMHAARESERNGWIPVSERLPENGVKIILWMGKRKWSQDEPPTVYFGRYLHTLDEWRLEGSNSRWNDQVTHWRPLPAAPFAAKGETDSVAAQGEQND